MPERIPILLDTDIGSDIDDAVALAYLLRQPRCELLGITTVTGDVAQRCACADVLCRAAGRPDVPIHAGREHPLLMGRGQPEVPQYEAIKNLPHRCEWPANTAVEFLRQTIRSRPGEITLLTIGPLGNIAALLAVDPEVGHLLKAIVSMAGIYFGKPDAREWNILLDPVAAAVVYNTPRAAHTSIGLDVTLQCAMEPAGVRQHFTDAILKTVADMARVWFEHAPTMVFHDPLAAVAIFDPAVCGYESGRVEVDIEGGPDKAGRSIFRPEVGACGQDRVGRTVNAARFFAEYFSVFAPA